MALTAKKKAFAQAKFDGANNKEAAIFAGCSPETASQAGSRMAKDSDVIAQLERLKNVKDVNRDVKPNPKPIVTKNDIDNVSSQSDPLKFLEEIWTDPVEDMKLRMDAAKAALPYFHGKVADKGKKQSQEEQAHAAAKGTGRFATRAARKANYS
ncbi:terminase small subunit [Acinetobacter johnsonii]|uniref:terminase small subunit n=1 Tax=Acinetobacter johnsonii TaxID=40214 RepID=UPI003D17F5F3